jgi:hypothetical protein
MRWRPPARIEAPPPNQPQHVGRPLTVGERCLLRRPGTYFDVVVQVRGIDDDVAAILIRDRLETVQLAWLRRSMTTLR